MTYVNILQQLRARIVVVIKTYEFEYLPNTLGPTYIE